MNNTGIFLSKILTIVGISLAPLAGAEFAEPTSVLTRDQALALAMSFHPELVGSEHGVRAAEARSRQAARLPNPELELVLGEYDRDGQGLDSAEIEVGLAQSLELGGKRKLRRELAQAESAMASLDHERMQREVRAATVRRFIEVLAGQRRLELARSTIDLAEQTSRAVSERVKAGREPPLQASKAMAELEMARIELADMENELNAARRALAAVWGSGNPQFPSVEGDLESVTKSVPSLDTARARLPMNPSLSRWDVELKHHEAAVSAERAARLPDVEVLVGYTRFQEDDTDAVAFGLGIPLPLFDRNRGNLSAAQHERARMAVERQAAEIRLAGELMEDHSKLTASYKRVTALRTRVVPAMEEAFEAAHAGYQQGKFGFLDMLDAQRGLFETRGALVDALVEYHAGVAEIERLTGARIEELMNENEENGR